MKRKIQKLSHPAILSSIIFGAVAGFHVFPANASGGEWTCPIASVTVGTCTCTSTGCHRYGGDGYWVCSYTPSSPTNCNCPPLDACDEPILD